MCREGISCVDKVQIVYRMYKLCREGINCVEKIYSIRTRHDVTSTWLLLFNNLFARKWLEEILPYFTVLPGIIHENNKHKIRAEGTVLKCRGHQTAERLHRSLGVNGIE